MAQDKDEEQSYPLHEGVEGVESDGRYLKAQDESTWDKPEDIDTWGDYMLRPDKPLLQRHLELCRMAAHGKTNAEIAEKLGYTQGRVSVLLSNQRIKDQVQLYRDRLFQVDTKTRMKELAPDALDVIHGILNDEHMSVKEKEKAAMWVLEKVDGKAAQQTDVNVTGGVGFFLDRLDQLTQKGQTLDVTPRLGAVTTEQEASDDGAETEPPKDDFAAWLNTHVKD